MAQDEEVPSPAQFAHVMQERTRKEQNFDKIEDDLPNPTRSTVASLGILGSLSRLNPFRRKDAVEGDIVWLLDNTAFRQSRMAPWQAEFVTAMFAQEKEHKLVDLAAGIARIAGLADDANERKTIEDRLQPFSWDIRVGKVTTVAQEGARNKIKLGLTGASGCSSAVVRVSSHNKGSIVGAKAVVKPRVTGILDMQTFYAGPEGWAVISDIDDTIKITMTSDPIGILRETFINEPRPIPGMPELYAQIKAALPKDCPWFYLSASPYNLYPFLKEFRHKYYPPGTLVLRDSSWRSISGLLASLTVVTEEYKVDRMKKINGWFPKRKLIVFGDSTQSDPEAYGEIYRTFPGWIELIFIRKATDIAMIGIAEKNEPERFEKAFKDIPKEAWHVFEDPTECIGIIKDKVAASRSWWS